MKTVHTILLLALLLSFTAAARAADLRSDSELSKDWKFLRQDVPDAQTPAFDDSKWDSISLPHTWNAQDGQDGGNNYYRGPAWYRTHLTLTPDAAKSYFLQFDAASTVADVYLNGKKVGSHSGGFAAFCFDITPLLTPGDNLLAVRVTNAKDPHVAPLNGDFTIFGGLYRPVHLLTRNKISISPIDDGIASSGIYLKQTSVTADQAKIDVTLNIRNDTAAGANCSARITLRDAAGKVVVADETHGFVPPNSGAFATATITIDKPHLWNGTRDPYLYTVSVDLVPPHKEEMALIPSAPPYDSTTQPLGLRFFRTDPDKGFFLNGQPYALHGVNRHQDRLDKGWAVSPADHAEDYKLMAEMGCTMVRLCHYEHGQTFLDLCDHGGMVVWAELGLVNDIDFSSEFATTTKFQLIELIKQNYNHPSICFWSLYNELNAKSTNDQGMALMGDLNSIAHRLDPTRLTVGANSQGPNTPIATLTDLSSLNRYDGWYTKSPGTWPATLDDLRKALPGRSIAISEYGAGGSIFQHEDNPTQPKTGGRWHPEEWQCIAHEAAWKALSQRPWLWGTMLWVFADFAADNRSEGDTLGRNDKGMVTADRKTKKDVYYFYQANWTTTPMVHINCPEKLPYSPTHIKVYSNADSVELFADGKSLGTLQAKDHIFDFKNLTLPASGQTTIKAVAYTSDKKMEAVIRFITLETTTQLTIDPTFTMPFQPKPAP